MTEQIVATGGMVLAWMGGLTFAALVDRGHAPWKYWCVLACFVPVNLAVNVVVANV